MDAINDILIDCVKHLGGSKRVGCALWPTKPVESAQRLLLNCLNEDRPEHLAPECVVTILRMAKRAGYHAGVAAILEDLGYAPTQPLEPQDELAELQRQVAKAQQEMSEMLARINDLQAEARPHLRMAA